METNRSLKDKYIALFLGATGVTVAGLGFILGASEQYTVPAALVAEVAAFGVWFGEPIGRVVRRLRIRP